MSDRLTYIYRRVSTEEQARGGVSLDDQQERALAYVRSLGMPIDREHVHVLTENGVSGSVPLEERPMGAQLVARVREGAVANVVAFKLDRLFRDAGDALKVTKEWDKLGVALHLVDHGGQALNTRTAFGKAFFTMAAAFAELERNLISERTRSALQHKQARGDRLGAPPLGYLTTGNGHPPVAADGEMDTVRLILKLRRRDPERWTFREIAARLAREGHRTKRGGSWAPQTVKRVWDRRAEYSYFSVSG